MTNETMRKFGYPDTLIREYEHWVVLLRPAQVTLGSLVLAAKSDADRIRPAARRRPMPNWRRSPPRSKRRWRPKSAMSGSTI